MSTAAYRALPFPLCNLSDPDEPVTLVHLCDTALLLLRRTHCTLRALSLAVAHDTLLLHNLSPTLAGLAGEVDLCRHLIDRAPHGDLRDKAVPVLRSAYVDLWSLSLRVARDQVLLEDLTATLTDKADKIEVCRDLVDHVTCDR